MEQNLTAECSICGGGGYIYKTVNGYSFADECSCVTEKKIERYLRSSGVDYEEYLSKSISTFKVDTDEAENMKQIAEQFLEDDKATGAGYFGKSGTGKTHICIAICQELTRSKAIPHFYFAYRREIQRLKSVFFHSEDYDRLMSKWTSCKVLFIDDLFKFATDRTGTIQTQDLQIMFDIINSRYLNKAVTIFSSEFALNDIKNIDAALASRIYEMIGPYRLKCEGDNRRFKGGLHK